MDNFSFAFGEDGLSFVVGLRSCRMGMIYLSPSAKDKLRFVVGLRSCRAGSYFRYAAKVGKGAPKEEGQPFRAVFLLPLESIIFSADRGTPPGVARRATRGGIVADGIALRRFLTAMLRRPAPAARV